MLKNEELEIQVMGGLGNQLHGLSAGIVIANKLRLNLVINAERVNFGSNMARRSELQTIFFPESSIHLNFKSLKAMQIKYFYELLRRKSKGVLPMANLFSEPDYFDTGLIVAKQLASLPETTRSIGGSFIDFEWADEAVNYGFPSELNPISSSNAYIQHLSRIRDNSVALHVRLGDYLRLTDIFPVTTEDYYFEALDLLKIVANHPIHIFTDSPDILKDIFPKLLKDRKFEIIDPKLNFRPVEVMSLMSKYRNIITSNSTFSSWAAWFSPNKKVVTPVPHLKNNWIDRLPPQWLRIPLN